MKKLSINKRTLTLVSGINPAVAGFCLRCSTFWPAGTGAGDCHAGRKSTDLTRAVWYRRG